jgi:hypothetical protein
MDLPELVIGRAKHRASLGVEERCVFAPATDAALSFLG